MTHGRKPRKPRAADPFAFGTALTKAARLTPGEVATTIAPARACATLLSQGVATEDQHTVLHTAFQIAQGIEDSGIVRGLLEHIASALAAMDAIRARALATGTWRPTALHYYELDAIRTALDLHEYQLRQVSAGEVHAIARKLIARTQSSGGKLVRTTSQAMGLATAGEGSS